MDPANVLTKFEVCSFPRSWANIGYLKTLSSPWICLRSPFSKIFRGLLFGWTPWMYRPNLKSVVLPVPEIIAIEILGGVANPQSWGRGGRRGSEMVPFERALVSSYRPFSSIFTRFRDIVAFVLQHATFPHPTSSLLKIFPCFPGRRWMAFGLRRANVFG